VLVIALANGYQLSMSFQDYLVGRKTVEVRCSTSASCAPARWDGPAGRQIVGREGLPALSVSCLVGQCPPPEPETQQDRRTKGLIA
jgi:hypothetical protein